MGAKITVDSATLMNKGLEVIEAHEAFAVPYDSIEVSVHPQAILHSAVEMRDGAVIAQLGLPDMKIPIAYAFSWPHRLATSWPRLNLHTCGALTFHPPDTNSSSNDYCCGSSNDCSSCSKSSNSSSNEFSSTSNDSSRCSNSSNSSSSKWSSSGTLSPLGVQTFGCLPLAFAAGRRGGLYPAALSAANEEADVEETDAWARREAATFVPDPSLPL
ncbi:hypothetical protein Emag_005223 [Eimeria magna]